MTEKKDKSKVVEVAKIKGGVSWVQKQYDENGRLYCFDFFLPNMTMVTLNLPDSFELVAMIIQKGEDWAKELNEIGDELDRLEKEEKEED